jgi:AI-2 transport protein TqsA
MSEPAVQTPQRVALFAFSFIVVALTVMLLVEGRELLIPLAVAIVIWYVLNALAAFYGRLRIASREPPGWASMTVSILTVLVALALFGELISGNIAAVSAAAPRYQANLEALIARGSAMAGFAQPPDIAQALEGLNLRALAGHLAGAVAAFVGNIGIILIYVLFLLAEQSSFETKIGALFPDPQHREDVRDLLHRMQAQIQTYLAIKTLMSVATGVVSYFVLLAVGVDFAVFWGFVIFLLNYIPTIGSLLGIVLPALLTLVQFPTFGPFLIVLAGIGATQIVIGNFVEPKLMGTRLNISPLVVILSLALWGSIWGVAGMFLCVPLTVILMIAFAYFEKTRPIAIVLSGNGGIETLDSAPPPGSPTDQ